MSLKSRYEAAVRTKVPRRTLEPTVTTSEGRGMGSGRSSSASARLKIATLAPVPKAIERTQIAVSAGVRAQARSPWRRSWRKRIGAAPEDTRSRGWREMGRAIAGPEGPAYTCAVVVRFFRTGAAVLPVPRQISPDPGLL